MNRVLLLLAGLCYASSCKMDFRLYSRPAAHTNFGTVVGKYVKVFDANVNAFLGIPYAKPPVGDRRFKIAKPSEPWDGIVVADEKPPPCMQFSSRKFSWVATTEPREDCLYLNVWAPSRSDKEGKLPVLVWIHGGGFSFGSTDIEIYDGSRLASFGDVIVVSMNYRLGIFGFLNLGIRDAPGNVGLYDQALAMWWVKENIHHFGGDPKKITIFGESAGAISASLHLISPISRTFFSKAILQSGSAYQPQMVDPPEVAAYKATSFAQMLGCTNTNKTKALLRCFKEKNAMTLAKLENNVTAQTVTFFMPSYGNDFLPVSPIEAYHSGDIARARVLMGGTKDEGSFFLHYMIPDFFPYDQTPNISLPQVQVILTHLFKMLPESLPDKIFKYYFRDVSDEDSEGILQKLAHAFGDYVFNCPLLFLAENLKSARLYHFTHRSRSDPAPKWMGVYHFYEVPYVFGVPVLDRDSYTPEDGRFSQELMQKWISFARNGHPLEQETLWSRFSASNPTAFELNPRKSGNIPLPYRESCEFWRDVFASK